MKKPLLTLLLSVFSLLVLVACGGGGGVSSNPLLAEIRLSAGTLSPEFSESVTQYEAKVGKDTASITVTPIAAVAGASIKVNGVALASGAASGPIALETGFNTIRIDVVSQTQIHTRTYEIVVERLTTDLSAQTDGTPVTPGTSTTSNDAFLNALALSAGKLDQSFQQTNLTYTASVPFTVSSTTITAAPSNTSATMTLNGQTLASAQPSAPAALNEGLNTFSIVVTAPDGLTTKTYTLDITRATAAAFVQRALLQSTQTVAAGDFGFSTSTHGDYVAVGAPGEAAGANAKGGAVYLFQRNGSAWTEPSRLTSPNPAANGQFGYSVALDGDTLAIGAYGENSGIGRVHVYRRSGSAWTYSNTVALPSGASLPNIRFGYNVALSSGTLAVSTLRGDDGNPTLGGTVHLYQLSGTNATHQQSLSPPNSGSTDRHGQSIALSGNRLAVGSFAKDSECKSVPNTGDTNLNNGYVHIYERTGSTWGQPKTLNANIAGAGDRFGFSLSLEGDRLAVGAICEDSASASATDDSASQAGAVYVFEQASGSWSQKAYIKSGTAKADDLFGYRVALSGTTLYASAILGDEAGPDAGAVHVFVRNTSGVWEERVPATTPLQFATEGRFGASLDVSGGTLAVGANLAQNAFVFE